MSIYEIIMLVCFGSAWPLSIYKSYTSKSNKGKSLPFMVIILMGYIFGIIHKINYNMDNVIWLYAFNSLLVMADMFLFYINSKRLNNGLGV